jgi:putative transposase
VPGGMFFFTLVTDQRRPLFESSAARALLGQCIRDCQARWPCSIRAIVLLPDHLHAIWSLPPGDSNYSTRWAWIKKEFTKRWLATGAVESEISEARQREGRRGVWQPRFWEHSIRDEDDYERHFDYIHYNPVKHGYVRCPYEWPHSSFHRWVKADVYPWHWACWDDAQRMLEFPEIVDTVGE